jgi:hypothetical protein
VRGIKYRFASQDELRQFQQDPDRYIPRYGGWCAWHMYENEKMVRRQSCAFVFFPFL